jgi:hypothetical protein
LGSVLGAAGLVIGFFAALAGLRWFGGPIANPFATDKVTRVADLPKYVAVAAETLRIVAMAAAIYGLAISLLAFAAVATRRPDLEHAATQFAPPPLRRAIAALIGLGLLAATSTAQPRSSHPPVTVTASPPPRQPVRTQHPLIDLPEFTAPPGVAAPTVTPPTDAPSTTPTISAPTTAPPPMIPPSTNAVPQEGLPAGIPALRPETADLPRLWQIRPGDHLWRIAERTLEAQFGPERAEPLIDKYWRALIELNRDSLADPQNPDLVYVGQVIELPPLPVIP